MRLTTDTILDEKIEIYVDGSGQFSAEFNDNRYEAATRKELLEQLTKAVKLARQQGTVDVTVLGLIENRDGRGRRIPGEPFTAGAGVVQAKLRGKHAREHGAWLLVSDAGDKFQVRGWSGRAGTIARRLTEAEVADYLTLLEAKRVAETALENFVGAVKVDPEEELQNARKGAKS